MLSIKRLGKFGAKDPSGQGPLDYLVNTEIKKLDYYKQTQVLPEALSLPVWQGVGAKALGLSGTVDFEMIYALGRGEHPTSGKPLGRSHGDRHQVGQDLTFSAPKSVSLAYVAMSASEREQMLQAHQKAVDRALQYIEQIAQTRLGKDGVNLQEVQGIVAARFQHFASRELDPQLHTHAMVFNLALRQDGKWGTLESKAFYDAKMAAGALYRAQLADEIKKLGFDIRKSGKDSFEIEGFGDDKVEKFSTRRRQIQEALEAKGMSGALSSQYATLFTRREKDEPSYEVLMKQWEEQTAAEGLTPKLMEELKALALERRAQPQEPFELDTAKILSKLTSQNSTFAPQQALQAILVEAVGHWDADTCEKACAQMLKSKEVITLRRKDEYNHWITTYTTEEMYALEKRMEVSVKARMEERHHQVNDAQVASAIDKINEQLKAVGGSLNEEQTRALHWITQGTGGCAFVEGWAGTGKTTMLTAVRHAYESAGYELWGTALAGKAAKGLQDEAGIQSKTLATLLREIESGDIPLSAKSVVVIDEAGMVDSKTFGRLLDEVDKVGAKMVVIGDPKQLQPIAAGGIMRSLMRTAQKEELSGINRQRTDFKQLRKRIQGALSNGNLRLSKKQELEFKSMKNPQLRQWCLSLAPKVTGMQQVYDAWKDAYDYEWMRDVVKKIAREDHNQAASAIAELDSRGLFHLHDSRDNAIGDLVTRYLADPNNSQDKLILAGNREEVFALNSAVKAQMQEQGTLDPHAKHYRFYLNKEKSSFRDFGVGDRVIFTSINKKLDIQNGTLGNIVAINHTTKGVRLQVQVDGADGAGRIVEVDPEKFMSLDHGWAISCHKSQGATVNNAFVLMSDTMSDREWVYVAASRARFKTTLYAVEGEIDHLLPDNFHKLSKTEQATLEHHSQLKAIGSRAGKSRAKGTTLDWEKSPETAPEKSPEVPEPIQATTSAPVKESLSALKAPKTTLEGSEPKRTPADPGSKPRKGHFGGKGMRPAKGKPRGPDVPLTR